jgi:hypothetical protein
VPQGTHEELSDQVLEEHSPKAGNLIDDQVEDTPEITLEDNLDADHDEGVPVRYRAVSDIIGPCSPPGMVVCELSNQRLLAASAKEPNTLAEAEQDAKWSRAMAEELKAIEDNNTWTLTKLPQGRKAIGLKWVFKVKRMSMAGWQDTRHAWL